MSKPSNPEFYAFKRKLVRFAQRHPTLFASRHLAIVLAGYAAGVLGIGALVGSLVAALGLDWIDFSVIKPSYWLPGLRASVEVWITRLPDWVDTLASWGKWIVPVVIAILIGLGEIEKRARRKDNKRR